MSNAPSTVWVAPRKLRPSRWNAEFYRRDFSEMESELESSPFESTKLRKLAKLFTGPFGSKLPACIYNTPNGIPLLRVQNIGELFLNETDMAYIPHDVHQDIIRSKLEPGDLALAKAGRLGALSRIPTHISECNITQHIVGVKVNAKKVSPDYLAAFFLSKYGRFQLERQGVGTIIKYLGIEETRDATIPLPSHQIQAFIGAKVELAERCRTHAENLWHETFQLLDHLFEDVPSTTFIAKHNNVDPSDLSSLRMDAWYYQKHFMTLDKWLSSNRSFMPLTEIATLVATKRRKRTLSLGPVNYVEISSIDIPTSIISPLKLERNELPASAKKMLRGGDVIASTVRVNRKCIAVVPKHLDEAIGSTALAVLRTSSIEDAYFLEAVLKHDVSTAQIMRWNTGSVYPTVSEDVFQEILVPGVDRNIRKKIGTKAKRRSDLLYTSRKLIAQAKSDVEALIEGTLDTNAIMSGKLKPPTWEVIEKELKEM